jgi:hypothetical protein
MKYIEIPGEIDNSNWLILHEFLEQIKPQRVEIDIWFRDDDEEYQEPTKSEILDDIRKSLQEYSRGESKPASEMWDELMIQALGEINELGQLILDEPLKQTNARYVDVVIRFILDSNYIKSYESTENVYMENIALVREVGKARAVAHAG